MNKKKQYVKPEMERVQLVPEEAVLGGCKTASGGGANLPFDGVSCMEGIIRSCTLDATS